MNYAEFVQKYGDRPKDIVFELSRLLAYEEIISTIEHWEEDDYGMRVLLDTAGFIAQERGHLWPVADALRKKFNLPEEGMM